LALVGLKCTDFRCLEWVEIEFDQGNNLIYGQNASGKTSILEAVGYLGRGRSFRGANTREIVRHGQDNFVLFGKSEFSGRSVSLGVRNGAGGLEVHTGGEKRVSASALAESLPLQIIDPDVHQLISGGPEHRRRYIDWLAFHVEHGYLELWRRYRRALKQRNAALRSKVGGEGLAGWDRELVQLGILVNAARERVLDITRPFLQALGDSLVGCAVDFDYQRGWAADRTLSDAMMASVERDRQIGTTHAGPHRADLKLKLDDRQARKRVSRGQQKLLACALILSATEVVQMHLDRRLLLLLDDPAAELDCDSLSRMMRSVNNLGCQVVATTLDADRELFDARPRLFHVEHGAVRTAG
jgi:DNA replication and repair protein RecF